MTQRLVFFTVDRLKVKNTTTERQLDQVIPVRLCKDGCLFKPNIVEEMLPLSTSYGKPRLLELKYSVRRANGDCCVSKFRFTCNCQKHASGSRGRMLSKGEFRKQII